MDTVKSLILHHSFAIENEKVLSQGEILTFKKVLFYYLSEGNRIGKKETVTINKSIAARNFAVIAISAARELNFPLNKLVSLDKTIRFLRSASGLNDLAAWLERERNFETILKESGDEAAFKNLWKFGAYRMEKIATFEMLKKAVSDHRAWLRFISTMMRSRSLAEETILAGRRRGNYEQKWQKRKVFLHFLISATLGHKTVKEFGIENLCKFSQIAGGNYEEWREKIYDLFVKFFRESTLAVELWSHSEMIKLVSDLANPRFNHWLNFGKLMLSSTGECNRFTEIRQAFLKAVRLTACSIFESHKKGAIRGFVSDPVGSFNKRINALHPVSVYNALEVCPYLTAWLDDDNLFRMMAVSELLESGSQIRKLIEERNHFCWLKCSEILAKKISLAQVLQNLWSGRTFVDDFNILNHIPKPSDKWEVGKLDGDPHLHSIREILKETVFAGKLEGVYERIKDVYSFNCTLEKSSFSDEVLIALFFNFEKAKLPPDIRNSVLSLRGIKMLDDEMSAKLFKKEVAHLVKFARDKSGNGIEFEMPDEFADNTFNTEETVFTE